MSLSMWCSSWMPLFLCTRWPSMHLLRPDSNVISTIKDFLIFRLETTLPCPPLQHAPMRLSPHSCSHTHSPTYPFIPPSALPSSLQSIPPSNKYLLRTYYVPSSITFGQYGTEKNVSAPLELTLGQVAHASCLCPWCQAQCLASSRCWRILTK